ncbi:MAG: hypothetical protein JW750_02120 [Anaerolineaceae bacterium]|nr:hypothetical protein [Anaerolineaceae bacterium]
MKTTGIVLIIIAALAVVVWAGLRVNPKPFAFPALTQSEVLTAPLPEGLPAPVERFFQLRYGDEVPVIESVVLVGRGRMRPFGVWLPARYVITHVAGQDYRHYFEATFFGMPFLKVNEGIVDGESFFESPMGTYYDDPNTNQGANLALWAEGSWFPAFWATDPRVRWQAVDDQTAILFVPYGEEEESFVVRFDPETGLVEMMEAMRYKGAGDAEKQLWITNEVVREGEPNISYVTWLDDGKPWAEFVIEDMRFNLDVSEYIHARGN